MKAAATAQKSRREYRKHGDSYRQRLLKERGIDAIDGRTDAGKKAKRWRHDTLEHNGGKSCPSDTREEIEAATFYLWRSIELRSHIVANARRRGTPINKRRGVLPSVHDQHDTTVKQWREAKDGLKLGKVDLARRFMQQPNGGANAVR